MYFQKNVREMVMEHRKREEAQGGKEIWPAVPKGSNSSKEDEEEDFVSKLDEAAGCMSSRVDLTW